MKRIIIVFLALVLVVPLVAQDEISNEGSFKRYRFDIDISYLQGPGNKSYHTNYIDHLYKLNIINGIKLTSFFSLGIGTGVWYDPDPYSDGDSFLFPLYLDSRIIFPNRRFSPYLSFDAGIVLNGQNYWSGWQYSNALNMILDPSIGVCYKLTDNLLINVGFSYHPLYAYQQKDY